MKSFTTIIALVATAVATVVNAQVTWTNCASSADMNVSPFTLDPTPLCIGLNACATAVGSLSAPITFPSTLTVSLEFLGVTVYNQSLDLCSLLAAQGQSCPVPNTTTTIGFCIPSTGAFPTGVAVKLTVSATNGNGNSLFCQRSSAFSC